MGLNGMVLAAGCGTRLLPLTRWLPKPLLPVANRPVLSYGVRALRQLGIREICVNICYMAEAFETHFRGHPIEDVRLHWSLEETPLGTAGGMKHAESLLRGGPVVVVAGDAVLDMDLDSLLNAHRQAGAAATIGCVIVEDPSRFGVLLTDHTGRVQQYQEKPSPGAELSKLVSTGVYVFEPEVLDMIPHGCKCDFGLDIFPQIIASGMPFYAFPVAGYWTDIGGPVAYLRANLDYLAGKIGNGRSACCNGDNLIADGVTVSGVSLTRCIIGKGAVVPCGSCLQDCVVWPETVLPYPICASNSVLTPQCILNVEEGMSA